jgi:murein DD-endopeptidase MepM/ murein hydrolase activator NlpD
LSGGRRSASVLAAGWLAIASLSPSLGSERAEVPKFDRPAIGKLVFRTCGDPRDGLEMALPPGAEIHSIERGVVAYAGEYLKAFGKTILIKHEGGWTSAYANLGRIQVERGDRVERGQTIATAPDVHSLGDALFHFELRRNSAPVDPRPYFVGGATARTLQSGATARTLQTGCG